ncbi:MAG TPA: ParB/RepB/Spo0J family partition protein [Tepidisphaeraceae bacterium]|jgi:hypothetical protein|nr:ParB/RepB/Spo0J family partition protein [Tepidisphaeraceae bacterium]
MPHANEKGEGSEDHAQSNSSLNEAPASSFLKTHGIWGKTDSKRVHALRLSMLENGWAGEPIVVIEYNHERYIIDGHHRTYAARLADIMVKYRAIEAGELSKFGFRSIEEVVTAHVESRPNRISSI